jgi:hypothetical protein
LYVIKFGCTDAMATRALLPPLLPLLPLPLPLLPPPPRVRGCCPEGCCRESLPPSPPPLPEPSEPSVISLSSSRANFHRPPPFSHALGQGKK